MKLIKFKKENCRPCMQLAAWLDDNELTDIVEEYDVYENPEVAAEYGVMSCPTLIVLDEGEVVATHTGFDPRGLEEAVNTLFK